MSQPQLSQVASISVGAPSVPNTQVSQLASISVQGPPVVESNISQLGVIYVSANARGYVQLGPPIALDCWNPCNSYGTHATIIYIGGK